MLQGVCVCPPPGKLNRAQTPHASPYSLAGRGCLPSPGQMLAVRRRSEAVRHRPHSQAAGPPHTPPGPGIFGCFAPRHLWTLAFLGALHAAPSPPCSSSSPLSLLHSSHPSSSSSRTLPFPLRHPPWLFLAPERGTNSNARQGLQTRCKAGFAPHACSGVEAPGFAPWAEEVPNYPSATGRAAPL